jgi:hypothetical protein
VTTTAGLVVGYSWIDGQLQAPLNPGLGWQIWWKRTLITLIGLVASFIVCVLPKPSSVRAQLRRTFASTTYTFGAALSATLSELHLQKPGEAGARTLLASREGHQLITAYRALIASAPRVGLTKLEPAIHKNKVLAHSAAGIDALQREAADLSMQLVYVVAQLNDAQRRAFMATTALGAKDGAVSLSAGRRICSCADCTCPGHSRARRSLAAHRRSAHRQGHLCIARAARGTAHHLDGRAAARHSRCAERHTPWRRCAGCCLARWPGSRDGTELGALLDAVDKRLTRRRK